MASRADCAGMQASTAADAAPSPATRTACVSTTKAVARTAGERYASWHACDTDEALDGVHHHQAAHHATTIAVVGFLLQDVREPPPALFAPRFFTSPASRLFRASQGLHAQLIGLLREPPGFVSGQPSSDELLALWTLAADALLCLGVVSGSILLY